MPFSMQIRMLEEKKAQIAGRGSVRVGRDTVVARQLRLTAQQDLLRRNQTQFRAARR